MFDAHRRQRHERRRRATSPWPTARVFEGVAFGARGITVGEVVFTTGMTGYQEVLTDPSYCGQIVTMTAPQIGNTGINAEDAESVDGAPQVAGFVVRDASPVVSNWRASETLDAYLARHGIVAHRRRRHAHAHAAPARPRRAERRHRHRATATTLRRRAREAPPNGGPRSRSQRVTPEEPLRVHRSRAARGRARSARRQRAARSALHVVAIDFGVKRNILRCLVDAGCRVTVVPASTSAERDPRAQARRHLPLERPGRPGRRRPTPSRPSASCSARSRSSASASATSCSRSRSAARPTSSSSATAA